MKKFIISIPFIFLFFHFLFVTDGPNVWTVSTDITSPVWGIAVDPVNQNNVYAVSNISGAYKSTNAGMNFTAINSGLTNTILQCIDVSKTNPNIIMVGSTNTGTNPGVYKSTDGGATWAYKSNGITDIKNIQGIAISPANANNAIIAVFDGATNMTVGLYRTTDGGENWLPCTTGIGTIKNFLSVAYNPLNPNVIYAGTSFSPPSTGPSSIYRSNDGGVTWTAINTGLPQATTETNPVRVLSVATPDTARVLAALFNNSTNGGAYLTTNGGQQWTRIQNPSLPNTAGVLLRGAIIRPGSSTEFYVGLDGTSNPKGIYRTTNAGVTWTDFNGGPMTIATTVRGLAFKSSIDSTLFASGAGSPVGVLAYSFIPLGIGNNGSEIPETYGLYQNYPNPFNPKTNITYDVPQAGDVVISIYDLNGRFVASVVNNFMQAGQHTISVDLSSLSSGIYLYKMTSGNFTDTKKMMLVK